MTVSGRIFGIENLRPTLMSGEAMKTQQVLFNSVLDKSSQRSFGGFVAPSKVQPFNKLKAAAPKVGTTFSLVES